MSGRRGAEALPAFFYKMFQTFSLPQGLRIVCAPGQTDVVYLGIAVDAGTRDELPQESGMAHFTEHMSFKGTLRRSARQVITAMERVGGDLNAFTGKEETVYYCTCLSQHVPRAIDLLLDIAFQSTYPQEEMTREAEVVIDEIESYNDQPSELIYDEFESLIFPGHPLGRNILGDAETLRRFRSADMQRYAQRLYHPDRMVLYVLGNVEPERVFRLVEKNAACGDAKRRVRGLPTPRAGIANAACGDFNIVRDKGTRERNGLVYTVESNYTAYTDTGIWTVYYGCDANDRARCRRLVAHELDKLTQHPLSQRALDAARRQLKGQIGISYDNFENVAIGMAKRYLHYGKTLTKEALFERLDAGEFAGAILAVERHEAGVPDPDLGFAECLVHIRILRHSRNILDMFIDQFPGLVI